MVQLADVALSLSASTTESHQTHYVSSAESVFAATDVATRFFLRLPCPQSRALLNHFLIETSMSFAEDAQSLVIMANNFSVYFNP